MVAGWVLSLIAVVVWERRDTARPAVGHRRARRGAVRGRPSPVLRARIDHAIELWRRGSRRESSSPAALAIATRRAKQRSAQRYAIERGVPARDILIENSGRSTAESLQQVAILMQAEPSRDMILVSDPFHMLRLSILARRFGMTPYTSPTRTSPISLEPARVVEVRPCRIDQGADRVPARAA